MRCKQGDMAFIIKATVDQNLMKIVEVKEYIGRFERDEQFSYRSELYRAPDTDDYWWIETPASGSPMVTWLGETRRAYCPDSWLKPIPKDLLDGDPEHETSDLGHTHEAEA